MYSLYGVNTSRVYQWNDSTKYPARQRFRLKIKKKNFILRKFQVRAINRHQSHNEYYKSKKSLTWACFRGIPDLFQRFILFHFYKSVCVANLCILSWTHRRYTLACWCPRCKGVVYPNKLLSFLSLSSKSFWI